MAVEGGRPEDRFAILEGADRDGPPVSGQAGRAERGERRAAARLARLPAIDKAAGPVYLRSLAATMPMNCTPVSVKRLEAAAAGYKDLSAGTRRALPGMHQEDKRSLMIRQAMTVPKV
jgi:aminopeptidase N